MTINADILIVEDSLTQAMRLQHLLKKQGYQARVAGNGAKGLTMVQDSKPALIITDVMMPEMDGFEMCKAIKSNSEFHDIPVMILSSLSDPGDIIRGLESGADNFLTKPYEEDHLLRRIHHILTNVEMRKESVPQFALEVYFAGQRHKLTTDRFQIIDLLLSTFEAAVIQSTQLEKANMNYHQALEDIKQVQSEFRIILENVSDGVIITDTSGDVRYINPSAEDIFQVKLNDEQMDLPAFPEIPRNESIVSTMTRKDGRQLVLQVHDVMTNWAGEQMRMIVCKDITRITELETMVDH
ncbi:response regulator [Desulfonatronovibrio magnus]|uniref:response regulator n=1 Tax=Desulfonatronovibrio magnus TaxID=698827 RepID=UPI0006973706|nr:response regulator [Desulfonatronovibrio magnus]